MDRIAYLEAVLSGKVAPVVSPHRLQQPSLFIPGLNDRPWFDASEFPWIESLEADAPRIREELAALAKSSGRFAPYRQPAAFGEVLHDRGDWSIYFFHLVGKLIDQHCEACPVTAAALERVPRLARATGIAGFSELAPGTHITPHCGFTNLMIRCHLGLVVPEGCCIRVGDETRRWKDDECMIFDDAYEHEVWHEGRSPRVVLLFDIYHPDLTDEEVARLESLGRSEMARVFAGPWHEIYHAI